MGSLVRGLLVAAVLAVARPVVAQVAVTAPEPAVRFSISPEYAWDIHAFDRWSAHSYEMFQARVEFRPARAVSPWVSTGVLICRTCAGDGWLNFAGARFDLVREGAGRRLIPYGVAALGGVVRHDGSGFVPSAGLGVRLSRRADVAPRLEARLERYESKGYLMLGLGFDLGFWRHRPDGGVRP